MGKRKHWYVPCIAPALAALLLAGFGATVDLNEQPRCGELNAQYVIVNLSMTLVKLLEFTINQIGIFIAI